MSGMVFRRTTSSTSLQPLSPSSMPAPSASASPPPPPPPCSFSLHRGLVPSHHRAAAALSTEQLVQEKQENRVKYEQDNIMY